MSVINQMLHDLEARRERGAGERVLDSLGLGGSGAASLNTGRLGAWLILFAAAGVLAAVLMQRGGVALSGSTGLSPAGVDSVSPPVQQTGAPASGDQKDIQAESVQITEIAWQSGDDDTLTLIMSLDRPPAGAVTRRVLDNGEIRFVLPQAQLAAALPLLDARQRFFQHYRIGHREDAVYLNIKPHSDVSVEWAHRDGVQDNRHAWVLQLSLPASPPTSEQPGSSAQKTAATDKASTPAAAPPVKTAPVPVKQSAPSPQVKQRRTGGSDADRRYQRALSYLSADRVEPAVYELRKVMDSRPAFHAARELLASLYLQQGQDTEAFMLLKKGIALAPQHLAFARMYAEALVRRGRLEQAMQVLSQSEAYGGGDAGFQALYAATAQRLGAHQVAIERYMQALDIESEHGAWWMGLAMSLEADSRVEAAAGAYRAAVNTGQLNAGLTDYARSRLEALGASQ